MKIGVKLESGKWLESVATTTSCGDEVRVDFMEILFFEATESNFRFMSVEKASNESGNTTNGKNFHLISWNFSFFRGESFNTLLHTFDVTQAEETSREELLRIDLKKNFVTFTCKFLFDFLQDFFKYQIRRRK